MKKFTIIFYLVFFTIFFVPSILKAQNFVGDSMAVYKDSSLIKSWATELIDLKRGYLNIADTNYSLMQQGVSSNYALSGLDENVLGKADGQTVSLGDGGEIIVSFQNPIRNGVGPDFAVFENGFFSPPTQNILIYLELAFVEVSSDGENFYRFPAVSNQQIETQVSSFQSVDYRLYENLAGIFPVFWGAAFDLDDLIINSTDTSLLDFENINFVKIIDVVGSINPEYASYDSRGNIINESYPTAFSTGGFDLDAVAVINENPVSINEKINDIISIYPNPAKDYIQINFDENYTNQKSIIIYDVLGQILKPINNIGNNTIVDISDLKSGIYFIRVDNNINKIIVE